MTPTAFLLAAALALTPTQAGKLKISNVRNTYGELGGTRSETKFLPNDCVFVAFDIEGLSIGTKGQTKYMMAMEVQDSAGKAILKPDPGTRSDSVPFGGGKIPGRAFVMCGADMKPGEYTLKLTVTDDATKSADTLNHKFEVLKPEFGVASVFASYDESGTVAAPTTAVVGSLIFVRYGIVNFTRDPATKQPNINVEIVTLDENGQATLKEPITRIYNQNVPEDRVGFADGLPVPFTRAGKFKLRIKATDNVSKKSYTFDLPLNALPPG
jgi:hypothetical protein